jgi:hypothetical protein
MLRKVLRVVTKTESMSSRRTPSSEGAGDVIVRQEERFIPSREQSSVKVTGVELTKLSNLENCSEGRITAWIIELVLRKHLLECEFSGGVSLFIVSLRVFLCDFYYFVAKVFEAG